MAIGTIRGGSISTSVVGGADITPALPASMAATELMIAVCVGRGTDALNTPDFSTPADWNLVRHFNSGLGLRIKLFARAWVSGDAAPTFKTTSVTNYATAIRILAIPGADLTDVAAGSFIFSESDWAGGAGVSNQFFNVANIGPMFGCPSEAGGAVIYMGARKSTMSGGIATLSGDSLTWNELHEGNIGTLLCWAVDYALTPSLTNVTSKTFAVTGGSTEDAQGYGFSLKPATADLEAIFEVAASADDSYAAAEGWGGSWPPTAVTAGRNAVADINLEKNFSGGLFYLGVGLVRWDTSVLDDSKTIVAAYLRGYVNTVFDLDGRSISGEWHLFNPANDVASWTNVESANAIAAVPIANLVVGAKNLFTLVNPDANINKTGYTGLRFHVTGSTPTALNAVNFDAFDEAFRLVPLELIVRYTDSPPQIVRPVSHYSSGAWVAVGAATMWEALDEAISSDADYAESGDASATSDEFKQRLGPLTDPGVGRDHIVRFRYKKKAPAGDRVDLTVTLYRADGTTAVAAKTIIDIGSVTTDRIILTAGEADSIPAGDYATGLVIGFKIVKV